MRPILGDPVRGQVPGLPGLGYVGPPEPPPPKEKHKGVPLPNEISQFSLPKRHAPERVLCFGELFEVLGSHGLTVGKTTSYYSYPMLLTAINYFRRPGLLPGTNPINLQNTMVIHCI